MKTLTASVLLNLSICFGAVAQSVIPTAPALIDVAVGGAVLSRGHYRLSEGAKLIDGIAAAGGLDKVEPAEKVSLTRGDKVTFYETKKLAKQGSKGPTLKDGDSVQALFVWR